MTRLARGNMPWPTPSASDQPAFRGVLTVEEQIDPGTRLRLTAWPCSGPDGTSWLSLEIEPYPRGGRMPRRVGQPITADKKALR